MHELHLQECSQTVPNATLDSSSDLNHSSYQIDPNEVMDSNNGSPTVHLSPVESVASYTSSVGSLIRSPVDSPFQSQTLSFTENVDSRENSKLEHTLELELNDNIGHKSGGKNECNNAEIGDDSAKADINSVKDTQVDKKCAEENINSTDTLDGDMYQVGNQMEDINASFKDANLQSRNINVSLHNEEKVSSDKNVQLTREDLLSILHVIYELPIQRQQFGLKNDSKSLIQHLEAYYDKFHRNSLIQAIFHSIYNIWGDEISKINLDSKEVWRNTPKFVETIVNTEKWRTFVAENQSHLKALAKDIWLSAKTHNFQVNGMKLISIDSPISTMESGEWEYFSPFNPYESDYIEGKVTTNQELKLWSNNLLPLNPLEVRRSAMESYMSTFVGDFISRDPWKLIIESFSVALSDKDDFISESALQCFKNMYPYSHPEALIHLHYGVIKFLKNIFESNSTIAIPTSINDPTFAKLLPYFELLNQWQIDLPNQWVGVSEVHCFQLFSRTFEIYQLSLFSSFVSQCCEVSGVSNATLQNSFEIDSSQHSVFQSPLLFISLVDPEANWFRAWNLQCRRRKYFCEGVFQKQFFRQISQICNFVANSISIDENILKGIIEDQHLFLMLIHSILVICDFMSCDENLPHVDASVIITSIIEIFISLPTIKSNNLSRQFQLITTIKEGIDSILFASTKCQSKLLFTENHLVKLIQPLLGSISPKVILKNLDPLNSHVLQCISAILSQGIQIYLFRHHLFLMDHEFTILQDMNECFAIIQVFCKILFTTSTTGQNSELKISYIKLCEHMAQYVELNRMMCSQSDFSRFETLRDVCDRERVNNLYLIRILSNHLNDEIIPKKIVLKSLTYFGTFASGLMELHRQGVQEECAIFLLNVILDSKEDLFRNYWYLLCQYFTSNDILKIVHEIDLDSLWKSYINDATVHFEWIPWSEHIESYSQRKQKLFIHLILSMPTFVNVFSKRKEHIDSNHSSNIVDTLWENFVNCSSQLEDVIVLGLSILDQLTINLNSYLILECEKSITEFLTRLYFENDSTGPGENLYLDEVKLLCNKLLCKLVSIGGPSEKVMNDYPCNSLKSPNPFCGGHTSLKRMELESVYNVKLYINRIEVPYAQSPDFESTSFDDWYESISTTFEGLKNYIRRPIFNFFSTISYVQLALKKRIQSNTSITELYQSSISDLDGSLYEGDEGIDKFLKCGDKLILQYAKYLMIPSIDLNMISSYRKLVSTFLYEKENQILSAQEYDWFSLIVLLVFANSKDAFNFLRDLCTDENCTYLWYTRGKTLINKESKQNLQPIYILTELVEMILSFEWEEDFNLLQQLGLSCLPFVQTLVSQFFLNFLDYNDIVNTLLITSLRGSQWLVYICISYIHHACDSAKRSINFCKELEDVDNWKYVLNPTKGFKLETYMDFMERLEAKYQHLCKSKLSLQR